MSPTHEHTDNYGRKWYWYANALEARYCLLQSKKSIVDHTLELGRGVIVDYDAMGDAIGIEFL